MTLRRKPAPRIAIEGRYLDEVRIRQALQWDPRSVCFLAFPATRHRALVEGPRVTISAQAPTIVQLFAEGILPAVGTRPVRLEIAGKDLGAFILDTIESGERTAIGDMIVLRFHQNWEQRRD